MKVLPLFKSHYSIGRSILTLEKAGTSEPDGPNSIIDLALDNKLNRLVLVEDSFSGFLEAYTNCLDAKIPLAFGLRMTFTEDLYQKTEAEIEKEHKLIIFAKGTQGYKRLIKIYTKAAVDGYYYEPRLDFKTLKEFWNEDEISLAVPFYDSFIFNNVMLQKACIPDFSFAKPIFFTEYNYLPFDSLIKDAVVKYTNNNYSILPTKSIYYAERKDFKAYLTFRCISKRTKLEKPNMDHMSSNEFCLESWKEANV